jgi:hypothetical protein
VKHLRKLSYIEAVFGGYVHYLPTTANTRDGGNIFLLHEVVHDHVVKEHPLAHRVFTANFYKTSMVHLTLGKDT